MNEKRRPILYKGEAYSRAITKKQGGPPLEPNRTFEEAKKQLVDNIKTIRESVNKLENEYKLPTEFIVCLRLDPEFSAKSHEPNTLFSILRNKGIEEVGSRLWREGDKTKNLKQGRMIFARATDNGLKNFENILNSPESNLTGKFKLDIRKVKSLDTLKADEKIAGFNPDWISGPIEVVIHPFEIDKTKVLDSFFEILKKSDIDVQKVKFKQYEQGITFISFNGNKKFLENAAKYNPLRTVHPLTIRELPIIKSLGEAKCPKPPTDLSPNNGITVGVFDGGIQKNNKYLNQYCEDVECTKHSEMEGYINHGTGVVGLILYGPLNKYDENSVLPPPPLKVKSFRVLPTGDVIDLYEVIDAIEEIVPKEKNISVYNLSMGPDGPILDDHITRFTYACDLLNENYGTLFCVAVGNDGKLADPLNRIQSPSDLVNGLGVGAYTKINGKIIKAPYSCIGPGREGNKLKPDLSAFGGCDNSPIHLLSTTFGVKWLSQGTSFASPLVARIAALLIGSSSGVITDVVSRALLIHSAQGTEDKFDIGLGHGFIPDDVEDVISCGDNSYSVIYQGEILPNKFVELKIPWVTDGNKVEGNVKFSWTLVTSSPIDIKKPDNYTNSSAEICFYPNTYKYSYFNEKTGKRVVLDTTKDGDLINKMLSDGWKQSSFPISESGPQPFMSEEDSKTKFKWDTVIKRLKNKQNGSYIKDPFFHLHTYSRGGDINRKIRYALVLSVSAPKSKIDLYPLIVKSYPALLPLQLQIETQVQVNQPVK